jgi:hypothetical protein
LGLLKADYALPSLRLRGCGGFSVLSSMRQEA